MMSLRLLLGGKRNALRTATSVDAEIGGQFVDAVKA